MMANSKFVLICLILTSVVLGIMFLFLKPDIAQQIMPKNLISKNSDSQLPLFSSNNTNNPSINIMNERPFQNNKKSSESQTKTKAMFDIILENPNEIVLKYINLPYDYKYGSNSIPLVVSSLLCDGDLLELGMGSFSTPLLHRVGIEIKKQVVSIDTQLDWVNKFAFYRLTPNHKVLFMTPTEMDNFGLDKKWGLVLVDHLHGEKRYLNMIKFAQLANVVIVITLNKGHDAEKNNDNYYKYEQMKVRDNFKYACKYSIYDETKSVYISTLILSNFIDVTKFKSIFDKIATDYGQISCDLTFK